MSNLDGPLTLSRSPTCYYNLAYQSALNTNLHRSEGILIPRHDWVFKRHNEEIEGGLKSWSTIHTQLAITARTLSSQLLK